jgi:hypothetical protein
MRCRPQATEREGMRSQRDAEARRAADLPVAVNARFASPEVSWIVHARGRRLEAATFEQDPFALALL